MEFLLLQFVVVTLLKESWYVVLWVPQAGGQ